MSAIQKNRKGYTVIEIMIVVMIIGLLASLAVPAWARARTRSQRTNFINDMRVFAGAAEFYMLDTGEYLEDSSSGSVPAGFEEYINTSKWIGGTPIGGVWDVELDSYGIKAGFGVDFGNGSGNQTSAYMQEIDAQFDDGDLITGKFRQIDTDRYYYILEDA